jgi:hypothetical protein
MVYLRNISVDTLHKGDTKDNNEINSNAMSISMNKVELVRMDMFN